MIGGLVLAGCADDDFDDSAAGSAFSQALFKDYTDLATQAAAIPMPQASDDDGFFSFLDIFGDDEPDNVAAKLFSAKAALAESGQEPAPEAAPDAVSGALRARLVRAVDAAKTQFPDLAAAAQSDFDCWVVYAAAGLTESSANCKTQFDGALARLEAGNRPVPPPAPVISAPVAPPPPPAAAPADFTVYFDFDSWTLTAEDLTVLTNVINTARAGGQAHITVVGHTDTSGDADYNQKLSVHRGNVVLEALVDMGARRAAIQVSGVGENDLAVATGDGVREAKNRRAVITLVP
jgi:outer membrane protein OmpA-like peptidoglycan-associated protein